MIDKNKISVSYNNKKLGSIPSVSLPPVVTCPKNAPCFKLCMARGMCNYKPNVLASYERNFSILERNYGSYWLQLKAAACTSQYFRYHVSGDIPTAQYFQSMVDTAEELKNTRFLCFTKKYKIVNDYLNEHGGTLPENLQIVFSEWGDDWEVPNPFNLPTAAVVFKGKAPKENWKICGGKCNDCVCRGIGCWELKRGETIAFDEH